LSKSEKDSRPSNTFDMQHFDTPVTEAREEADVLVETEGQERDVEISPKTSPHTTVQETQPPTATSTMIAQRLRVWMLILLIIQGFLYILVAIVPWSVGLPVSMDMLVLSVGWYGQDIFRVSALNLYKHATLFTILVNAVISFIWTLLTTLYFHHFLGIAILLVFLFQSSAKLKCLQHTNKLIFQLRKFPDQSF